MLSFLAFLLLPILFFIVLVPKFISNAVIVYLLGVAGMVFAGFSGLYLFGRFKEKMGWVDYMNKEEMVEA